MSPYADPARRDEYARKRDRTLEYERNRKNKEALRPPCSNPSCRKRQSATLMDEQGRCPRCAQPELYALCQAVAAQEPQFCAPGQPVRSKIERNRKRWLRSKARLKPTHRVTPEAYEAAALARLRGKPIKVIGIVALGELARRGHGGKVGGGPNRGGD